MRDETPVEASWIQRIRVPAGFLFGFLFFLLAQPDASSLVIGIGLAAIGLILRIWASGYLRKHRTLAVSGPYCYTRNPLYLGSFLMGLGCSLAAASYWLIFVFLVVFAAIYLPVMQREEKELETAYGLNYVRYRDRVPLFFPRPSAGATSGADNFRWRQVILNREYKALLGFLIVAGFLLIKLYAL